MKYPFNIIDTEACLTLFQEARSEVTVDVDQDVWEKLATCKSARGPLDLESDVTVWWLEISAAIP